MRKFYVPALVAASGLAIAAPASATATAPDYTSLTGAIDVSTTLTALMAVGAIMITVTLAVFGIRKVIRMVRG